MPAPTIETKVEQQSDGSWRVMTTTGSSWWGIGADFPSEAAAEVVARTIREQAQPPEAPPELLSRAVRELAAEHTRHEIAAMVAAIYDQINDEAARRHWSQA